MTNRKEGRPTVVRTILVRLMCSAAIIGQLPAGHRWLNRIACHMNRNLLIMLGFVAVSLLSCNKEDSPDPALSNDLNPANGVLTNYTFSGVQRQFILYKPDNLPKNAPLVFVLHGFTQTATAYYSIGFNQIADTAKFVVCYVQGSGNAWKNNAHNSEDVQVLKALAHDMQAQHSLNPDKTFATGFSMGGSMCNLLAMDAGDIFKAVAPVAGYFEQSVWISTPGPVMPIPYFSIHGTNDSVIPINGNAGSTVWKGGPAIQAIVDYWETQNDCKTTDTVQFTTNTTAYYHRNGTDNHEVWYYKIGGQGHEFPGGWNIHSGTDVSGFNACKEIWRFFRKW